MPPTTPIEQYLKHSKKTQIAALKRLDIHTVLDLLYHLPSRYEDAASKYTGTLKLGETTTTTGTIKKINMRKTRGTKRIMMTEATIQTEQGVLRAVWFHQPYIAKMFTEHDTVTVSGKLSGKGKPYLTNPIINKTGDTDQTEPQKTRNELRAVYPETHGISSLFISTQIKKVLSEQDVEHIDDPIPESIREQYNLPALYDALVYIHLPRNENEHRAAKKRFIFEQTFLMQIRQQMTRTERLEKNPYHITVNTKATTAFMKERFEFTPTKDQQKAVREILQDVQKNKPMARLLEGDVGSGKTAVAAAVMHGIVSATPKQKTSGKPQVVYLAPTEVLARQQFATLVTLFSHLPVQIGLITGKECLKFPSKIDPAQPTKIAKPQLKKWIASGEIAIIVGTHAIIQKDISFKRLALIIVDEQHRFGVAQRQHLIAETETHTPHLLSMTATPIPRTFALTIYGDLDLSVIEEMPKGRKPVQTKLVNPKNIQRVYDHIQEEVQNGHQAYVLCPRIEKSDDSLLRSVEEEYKHLAEDVFPDLEVATLHGKMKSKEKQEIVERFRDGKIQILVCTTVIEVGVNVPNATIIAILHAERFGLAQLHQLRGRVIRSSHQPHCYAITGSKNELTMERLHIFETVHNGFTLAQKDLDLRGSGELMGLKQSGVPDLVMEGLQNPKILAAARNQAEEIVASDPTLAAYPVIQNHLENDTSHNE